MQNGNPCNVPVNSAKCQYCSYHVASEYKRIQTKRIELQGNALKTAFGGKNSLKWKPGHFVSAENAQKPILGPVSKEEMKNLALKAAQASSKTGARYLRTVADPEGAKADAMVAEQARERSRQSTQNIVSAPLPLPRVAAVVYQAASISHGCDSKVKGLREKMVALEDSKVANAHSDQNARKRALEILSNSKSLPSQPSNQKKQATPKFLEAAVHAKARNSQAPPHNKSPLPPPNITKPQSAKVGVARNLNKAQSTKPNVAKSSFELAFGSIIADMETEKGAEMMHHSKYQDLVEEDQEDQLGMYLDVLERKDALATKMDSIKSLQVHAWRCHACQCVSEYKSKRCSESHPHALQKIQVTKRWWECVGCKKRFSTVGIKYPSRCPKCGVVSGEFNAMSMLRKAETRATGLDQEKFASREGLLARGIEQKWVNQ
jgi:rubrerythrin